MKLILALFGSIGFFLLVASTGFLYHHEYLIVENSDTNLYQGSEIITKKQENLHYKDTLITLGLRTNFTIKYISDESLRFYMSRGHFTVNPNRAVTTCTRAVCTTSSTPFEIRYYTPGEIVDITSYGDALVVFKGIEFNMNEGYRIRIDELTGQTTIHSPNEGIETLSTP